MMTRNKGGRSLRIFLLVSSLVLLFSFAGAAIYLGDYYRANDAAEAAFPLREGILEYTDSEGRLCLVPEGATVGFVFYPGGKVDHTAYLPLMRALANEGILCVLAPMPFRLAVLDMDAAAGVEREFPSVTAWYIGGHSLGGSMASAYLEKAAAAYRGVVLLGAYSTVDLSESGLSVLSVYGEHDGVMNREKYAACLENLPSDTVEIVLPGGNHAYFGMYGEQKGDGEATLTPEEQIRITATAIQSFIGE